MPDGSVKELEPIFIFCSNCGRYMKIDPSCGKRNCPRCSQKRAFKLELKHVERIIQKRNIKGHMWSFVNLTGVHIPLEIMTVGSNLRKFGNAMQKVLSVEYPDGGIAVIEHTISYRVVRLLGIEHHEDFFGYQVDGPADIIGYEPFLYVHGHAIVYGGYKQKSILEEKWGKALVKCGLLCIQDFIGFKEQAIRRHPSGGYDSIEGGRYVGIELVRNPRASVKYILKYIAKGIQLDDYYLPSLKRLKYVRTWGMLYGNKELTYDLICADCGGKCFVTMNIVEVLTYLPDNGQLKVKRVIKEFPGPPC